MTLTQFEEVVLLDADDRPIGRAPKSSVHGADTARHLAFSCHVFNRAWRTARDPARTREAGVARGVDELVLRPPRTGRDAGARHPTAR